MEKINHALFKKQEISQTEQFLFRGGSSERATNESTTKCLSTFFLWTDCETRTDTHEDIDLLPAANNMPSR